MSHPFGDLLTQHLHRKHGLSQSKLAAGILQSPSIVTEMCQGKRLNGPQARERVVAITAWLHQQGALDDLNEVNALLSAAGMSALHERHPHEAALSAKLRQPATAAPDLPAPSLRLTRSTLPRHNLPKQLTSFVGREAELADLLRLIQQASLLTLVGVGGAGKTRLAQELGERVLGQFSDGVWHIQLAALYDPALLPRTVAQTLKLPGQPGQTDLDWVIGYFETKQALLILDNCEHLLGACAELASALLQTCARLRLLATSREALNVPGEQIWPVTPLNPFAAGQLFVDRARAVQPDFVADARATVTIGQICRRLDGLPLAIELAASRLKGLSLDEIAKRLDDRFGLLTSGSRVALPRHQTLRTMIDWSHDLLTNAERILLRRLAIFAGGWTLAAAEVVCAEPEGAAVLDLHVQLVQKSLVVIDRSAKDTGGVNETRHHLLETIREYALEKLVASGELERLHERHAAYLLQLAQAAEPELRRADQIMWLDRLQTELDNFRAALTWSLAASPNDRGRIELGLRLATALMWFWSMRGYSREGDAWLEGLLSAEMQAHDIEPRTQSGALVRAKALNADAFLMDILHIHRDYTKQTLCAKEGLALSRTLGDTGKRCVAFALFNVAIAHVVDGDSNQAQPLFDESLKLYQELGDKFGMAECLFNLGNIAIRSGRYEQSRLLQQESLALRVQIGDKDGMATAYRHLGEIAFRQDDLEQAMTLLETSQTLYEEIGNMWGVSYVLDILVFVTLAQGHPQQAMQQSLYALSLAQDTGLKLKIAYAQDMLAHIALSQGEYNIAQRHYEEAFTLNRDADDKWEFVLVLCGLGSIALAQGEYEQSAKRYDEALQVGRDFVDGFSKARALFGLGRVAQARGDFVSAHVLYTEALALRRETHEPWAITASLDALATLAADQGQAQRAARLFGAAETSWKTHRLTFSPFDRDRHDCAVLAARSQLGEANFASTWADGQTLLLDEAIALALCSQ